MTELLKKEQKILEIVSDIFIFILILIFPLIVDKTGFFHILECKWYAYIILSSCYLVTSTSIILYFLFFKKVNYFKKKKLSKIQMAAFFFWLINILSCLTSPYLKTHNLFVGVGRGEGLLVTSLYISTFLYITEFARFKRKHLLYFSLSSILINTIAILQYIGFNPFNMYQGSIGTHNVSFMATIGNIDFISALYCLLLSVSFNVFVFLEEEKKSYKVIHLLSVFMGFFILGIIDVQSGKVAFLATLALIFPFLILNNKRLSRALIMLATILLSYGVNIIINPEYHYDLQKLALYFQFNYLVILFLLVCGTLLYLSYVLRKNSYTLKNTKKVLTRYYGAILISIFFGLVILYRYDFKSGILYEIHELLHGNFDDNFGTYRVFLWKRTLLLLSDYPLLGSGPDTFSLRFMARFTEDISQMQNGIITINDTAANVYLTMLVNLGVVGLLNYILFLFWQLKDGLQKMNPASEPLLVALICYWIQDFFNLSVVIVSPIFWLLMALHSRSLLNVPRKPIEKKENL